MKSKNLIKDIILYGVIIIISYLLITMFVYLDSELLSKNLKDWYKSNITLQTIVGLFSIGLTTKFFMSIEIIKNDVDNIKKDNLEISIKVESNTKSIEDSKEKFIDIKDWGNKRQEIINKRMAIIETQHNLLMKLFDKVLENIKL